MEAPSRIFQRPLNCLHCSQLILHPDEGCLRYFLKNVLRNGLSGLKYFSPLLITPLMMKYKTMNRELFINITKNYLQTVCWADLSVSSVFFMVCCFRNYFGRFRKYTTFFIPTVMGFQFCWFFQNRVMRLFTTATTQSTLEGILRQYANPLTKLILHSTLVQTLLFMINSAIILHYKHKNIYKDYWFITPDDKVNLKKETDSSKTIRTEEPKYDSKSLTKCGHTEKTCSKFVLDGMTSYLKFGIPLDLLSMIMRGKTPRGTQGILSKIIANLKTFRPNMTGFFLSYVGIYRLSSCILRKYYSHLTMDLQHILAAFLGGSSYLCVNKINFLTLSVVISTQIFWQEFCNAIQSRENHGEKQNMVLLLLKNVPFSQIIFCLNGGYLVHNYVINHHLVNSLGKGFIDTLSSNATKNLRESLTKYDTQTLVELAQSKVIKTLL